MIIVGLVPGQVDDLKKEKEKFIYINSVLIDINESNIVLDFILKDLESLQSNLIIMIDIYDLEEDENTSLNYNLSANSTRFEIEIPKIKNKTLYDIFVYQKLYPDFKTTYNFILYGNNDFLVDNIALNPWKIDFDKKQNFYESFTLINAERTKTYNLKHPISLPYFDDELITVSKVELWIDVKCDFCSKKEELFLIEGHYQNNKISINNQLYYDSFLNKISLDNENFKINGLNIPIDKFSLIIKFYGVGESFSNIIVEQEYINDKKILGDCGVSIFCFQ